MTSRKVGIIRRAVAFTRAVVAVAKALPQLASVDNRGGWWPVIRESFAGAWQQNITVDTNTILAFSALYRCIALISGDIAKLRVKLVALDADGVWKEVQNPAYSPVLRKPNHFQNRIQFFTRWVLSLLIHGNTYVLKVKNRASKVERLYVLDPTRVWPLVAPNGDVYYKLSKDDLAGVRDANVSENDIVVPASEIIHDRVTPLFHDLVGIAPIRAAGLAALQGLKIQENSTLLFQNGGTPGGVLTTPGHIPEDTAARLTTYWNENFTGDNVGKVAILGDGLKFEPGMMKFVDAQLIEQLKWTEGNVCTAMGVPPYMVGIGTPPAHDNIEALNQQYYSQCLQIYIESIEVLLDEGLGLNVDGEPLTLGTEFDLDDLLRMDTSSRITTAKDALTGGMSMNEVRRRFHGLGPVAGGDKPFLQEQNWPVDLLAARELPERPPTPPADTTPPDVADEPDDVNVEAAVGPLFEKAIQELMAA